MPESEYALSKYGMDKSKDTKIDKIRFDGFKENWSVSYSLNTAGNDYTYNSLAEK